MIAQLQYMNSLKSWLKIDVSNNCDVTFSIRSMATDGTNLLVSLAAAFASGRQIVDLTVI